MRGELTPAYVPVSFLGPKIPFSSVYSRHGGLVGLFAAQGNEDPGGCDPGNSRATECLEVPQNPSFLQPG